MDREVSLGRGDTLALLRPLDASEVRLLSDAQLRDIEDFAHSERLHAVDGKGETPLHIAARCGKLALCDLLIQHGADPNAKNFDGETASAVALAEGHVGLSQLLQALETIVVRDHVDIVVSLPESSVADPEYSNDAALEFSFEAEVDPESFRPASDTSGFADGGQAPYSPYAVSAVSADVEWTLDLSPAVVGGEGITATAALQVTETPSDDEFLVTQMRGKRSTKTATLPVATRVSIDSAYVRQVAIEMTESHRVAAAELEALVTACEGNAEEGDSWRTLTGILDTAGIQLLDNDDPALWDAPIAVDTEDLVEAIEAAFTRNSQLPGRGRFRMDRADQDRLLVPMLQAKDGLHLALTASQEAVRVILKFADMVLAGHLRPELFTLLAVFPAREDDPGAAILRDVSETLRAVLGEVIEGKRRRLAIQGVEKLDLSSIFFKALGKHLAGQSGQKDVADNIHALLGELEGITSRLIDAHLPYARRFASRYSEDGEDLEDVFQVAFMGLQRATRRFDPERGTPFSLYATAWMRQTVSRWRADEKALIRIPVHRHADLTSLDETVERLSIQLGRAPTGTELAGDRGWPEAYVEKLQLAPRVQVQWEDLPPELHMVPPAQEAHLDQVQTAEVVSEALAELDPRQADILRKRFGFESGGEMTLEEVGQIYGVTRERIRQIEAKALIFLSNAARVRRLRSLVGM